MFDLNGEASTARTKQISASSRQLSRFYHSINPDRVFGTHSVNAGDSEAAEAIRDLVETVTVFRNPSHPGADIADVVGDNLRDPDFDAATDPPRINKSPPLAPHPLPNNTASEIYWHGELTQRPRAHGL
jgi:hypothetical protein